MIHTDPKRLLLVWYGSFSGHGTLGDLRSVEVVANHLIRQKHQVFHATAGEFFIPGAERVDWRNAEPADYSGIIFICGPILASHPETGALFARFASNRLIGVGVSLMPSGHPEFFNPFESVIARQGGGERFGDLAILAPLPNHTSQDVKGFTLGISLRGLQFEYGENLCLWEETEKIAHSVSQSIHPERIILIENHLTRSGKSPDHIEQQYSECDLVITSRFHGAIMAIRHDTPFIALDQIRGGAKVHDLLFGKGWPHIYKTDEVEEDYLKTISLNLSKDSEKGNLASAKKQMIHEAEKTLSALDSWIEMLA